MSRIKKTAVVSVAAVVLIGGGVGFAAWLSNDSGTATADAGAEVGIVVTTAGAIDNLFPTKQVTVSPTVANNNDYPVQVDSVSNITVLSDNASCNTGGHAVTAVAGTLPRIDEGASEPIEFTVSMGSNSDDTCQNAVFTVSFDVSASSTA